MSAHPPPVDPPDTQTDIISLTAADVLHFLLLRQTDTPYEPPEPIFFKRTRNSEPQQVVALTLLSTHPYAFSITAPDKTIHVFKTTSLPNIFELSKTHPFLQPAPKLPSFFYTNAPFLSTTKCTLTIPQSQQLIETITAPYHLPYTPSISTWDKSLSLAIRRTWPQFSDTPHSCRLTITYQGQTSIPLLSITLYSPTYTLPTVHTSLLQNLLLNLLLSLCFPRTDLAANNNNPYPWQVIHVALKDGNYYATPYPLNTPLDAVLLDLANSCLALLAHPHSNPPEWLEAPLSEYALEKLPIVFFDTLFPPSTNKLPNQLPATQWVLQEYQLLQQLQLTTLHHALSC